MTVADLFDRDLGRREFLAALGAAAFGAGYLSADAPATTEEQAVAWAGNPVPGADTWLVIGEGQTHIVAHGVREKFIGIRLGPDGAWGLEEGAAIAITG